MKSFSNSSANKTDKPKEKPYYVTTPIFYVNASPHVGHLYSMILADVFKRWEVLKGEREAILCTGTDEHGMKVQRAAELQETPSKVFCDSNAENFKDLAKRANISNDHFIRTTDARHRETVEALWQRLSHNGYIYQTKHQGWYCVSDETFVPDSMLKKVLSPNGKPILVSTETGNAVEWTEETNYHFRLTALRDRLLQFYKENPEWVVPANQMAEVVNWVENHLEDLSISRPASRLNWGIPVPGDPSQTVYVWVDALANYLTTAGYPMWEPGSEDLLGWPADVHVIGKDIVRFHCVYWPALLMAADLPLPKRVLSHAHWLMNRRKMSKSLGNVVNPFFAIDRFGVDIMRFFLVANGGITHDADYSNEHIISQYKSALQGGLGNLLSRITRPKHWVVRKAITEIHDAGFEPDAGSGGMENHNIITTVQSHLEFLATMSGEVSHQMESLNPRAALERTMDIVYKTNQFISETAPWDLVKKGDKHTTNKVIFACAESLRIAGILLQPFMPQKSWRLLDTLGVEASRRTFADAQPGSDRGYGVSFVPLGSTSQTSLFPPLPVET